jgi:hypothetical protein
VGRDLPQKVEHRAVEPAGPQPLGEGWAVCLSAGSTSAWSAATDERSGQLARTPTPAGTATDRVDIGWFRERNARRRARTVPLARPVAVASDREPRASGTARSEVGSAAVGRSDPGGRRSVIGSNTSPRPRRSRRAFAIAPFVIRPRAWASSEAAGVAPAAWPRSFRRSRRSSRHQAVAERPATPPGRSRPSPGRSSEPRSPSCHQVWEPLPRNGDRLGHSIGLNAESRPPRERRAAGRRAQNPAISRQNREVARPGIEPGTPRFSVVCSTD